MKEFERFENHESNKSILEAIEPLPTSAKIEIIQMVNDFRPVAEITILPRFKEVMLPAIKSLKDSGLEVVFKLYGNEKLTCFVSKDINLAQEVSDLLLESGIEDSGRFGELMGFPPGSIDAYLNNKEDFLTEEEIENMIGFHNHFIEVRLSKSNLDESIEYLKKTYKLLLEQLPDIFEDGLPRGEGVDGVDEYIKKVSDFVYR